MPDLVYCVMGGGIVFATYRRIDLAHQHRRCITGTEVVPLDLDGVMPDLNACIEILDALPPEIRADIHEDWESDDDITPLDAVDAEISVDELDDGEG